MSKDKKTEEIKDNKENKENKISAKKIIRKIKKMIVRFVVIGALAVAGYGMWKNPQIVEQIKNTITGKSEPNEYQQQINGLRGQISSLQNQVRMLEGVVKENDFTKMENKIAAVEKINLNVIDSKADVATVLGVVTRLDKAEQKLEKLADVSNDTALTLTSVMLVKDAAERGGSFAYEAEVLANVIKGKPKMEAMSKNLDKIATVGILSEQKLQNEFYKIYKEIITKQKGEFEKTWKDRLNSKLGELVQIRKTNEQKPEFAADKDLEKITQKVKSGKLYKAVDVFDEVQNENLKSNVKLQQWVRQVKERKEFYQIINNMTAYSLAIMKVNFLQK